MQRLCFFKSLKQLPHRIQLGSSHCLVFKAPCIERRGSDPNRLVERSRVQPCPVHALSPSFFFFFNYWECSWSKILCYFQVHNKVTQLCISTQPFIFRLFSHVGHFRILSSLCPTVGPCWLSILCTAVCIRQSQIPHLSLLPMFSLWKPYVISRSINPFLFCK